MNYKNHSEKVEKVIKLIRIELNASLDNKDLKLTKVTIHQKQFIKKLIKRNKLKKKFIYAILGIKTYKFN